VSASAPAAASQAPCVPDALAADLTSPVWQPPPLRVERLPRDGCHTRFPCGSPSRGTKPGGLVPLPDPLPQQFNQQSNEQVQNILGWRHVPPRRASAPGYRRGDLADSPRYQQPHIATGSTLPPRACARHTCIAPSGERLTSTQSACLQDRLRYLQASPSMLFGTVAGGRCAAASRRKACHTPSSLRKLVAVSVATPAAAFKDPVWQPQRLPRARLRARIRGACVRTPYRNQEPACHTALRGR